MVLQPTNIKTFSNKAIFISVVSLREFWATIVKIHHASGVYEQVKKFSSFREERAPSLLLVTVEKFIKITQANLGRIIAWIKTQHLSPPKAFQFLSMQAIDKCKDTFSAKRTTMNCDMEKVLSGHMNIKRDIRGPRKTQTSRASLWIQREIRIKTTFLAEMLNFIEFHPCFEKENYRGRAFVAEEFEMTLHQSCSSTLTIPR